MDRTAVRPPGTGRYPHEGGPVSRRPIGRATSVFPAVVLVAVGFSAAACDFGRDPLLKALETHPESVAPATLYDSGATGMTVICPHQPRASPACRALLQGRRPFTPGPGGHRGEEDPGGSLPEGGAA